MNLESPEAEARGEEYLIEQIQGDKTATQLYIEMVNEPDGSVRQVLLRQCGGWLCKSKDWQGRHEPTVSCF